jgi:hypothetical protein
MMDDGLDGEGGGCDSKCLEDLHKRSKNNDKEKGTGGDNSCIEDDLCFDYELRVNCESSLCQGVGTGIGLLATTFDTGAFVINLVFALGADIAGLILGPEAYLAVAALYKIASPIPNIIGTYGGLLWGLQGITLGDSYATFNGTISSNLFRNNATMSITVSQDTAVSTVLDAGGWIIPDPNIATIASELGVIYDLGRNPLSPYLSSAPPKIPTLIAPTYSMSVNLSSLVPVSSGWSLFPAP